MNYLRAKVTFIICLLTLPVYIYLYKQYSSLFWILFFIERIVTPFIEKKTNRVLECIDAESEAEKNGIQIGKFLIFLIIFCIVAIGMFIFILFKYPRLFLLLMIGEAMDILIKKIFNKKIGN